MTKLLLPSLLAAGLLVARPISAAPKASSRDAGARVPPALETHHFSYTSARGRLGAQVLSMSRELRRHFGAPPDRGVLVDRVFPDSAGAKAGLKVGDVVTRVAGEPVGDPMDLVVQVAERARGEALRLEIVREKQTLQLDVRLDSDPDPSRAFSAFSRGWLRLPSVEELFRSWSRGFEPMDEPGDDGGASSRRLRELERRLELLERQLERQRERSR